MWRLHSWDQILKAHCKTGYGVTTVLSASTLAVVDTGHRVAL